MKLGLSIKIDVTKIDKSRLFKGEKGTYLDLTTFIDTGEQDQYGNHGFIAQSTTKEERATKFQTPILGNVKVFYSGDQAAPKARDKAMPQADAAGQSSQACAEEGFDDDIPF